MFSIKMTNKRKVGVEYKTQVFTITLIHSQQTGSVKLNAVQYFRSWKHPQDDVKMDSVCAVNVVTRLQYNVQANSTTSNTSHDI